jgi:hypothetical protein
VAELVSEAIDVGITAVHHTTVTGFSAFLEAEFETTVTRFDVNDFSIAPNIDIQRLKAGTYQAAKYGRVVNCFAGEYA